MSPLPVVYLVRPGNENEELRHSLRSLQNVPHGEVWIVGHRPPWCVGVRHVFIAQRDPHRFKYENAELLLDELASIGPDRFMLFNDDFYCMTPVTDMPRPAHRGPLRTLAETRQGAYGSILRATADLLAASGIVEPLAYTLHKPLPVSRAGLALSLEHGRRHRTRDERLSWRSIYGNLMRLGGQLEQDVKVHSDEPLPGGAWWSSGDASFKYHEIGRAIRRTFTRPSPYEQV